MSLNQDHYAKLKTVRLNQYRYANLKDMSSNQGQYTKLEVLTLTQHPFVVLKCVVLKSYVARSGIEAAHARSLQSVHRHGCGFDPLYWIILIWTACTVFFTLVVILRITDRPTPPSLHGIVIPVLGHWDESRPLIQLYLLANQHQGH